MYSACRGRSLGIFVLVRMDLRCCCLRNAACTSVAIHWGILFRFSCVGVDGNDITPTVDGLKERGISAILDYSTEADVHHVTGPADVLLSSPPLPLVPIVLWLRHYVL